MKSPEKLKKLKDVTGFKILQDNVLVEAIEIESVDEIIRPVKYEDKPEMGEVLSVGTGRLLDSGERSEMVIKVGDVVYYNKYSATKFNFRGKDYFTIREEDVIGYIR